MDDFLAGFNSRGVGAVDVDDVVDGCFLETLTVMLLAMRKSAPQSQVG